MGLREMLSLSNQYNSLLTFENITSFRLKTLANIILSEPDLYPYIIQYFAGRVIEAYDIRRKDVLLLVNHRSVQKAYLLACKVPIKFPGDKGSRHLNAMRTLVSEGVVNKELMLEIANSSFRRKRSNWGMLSPGYELRNMLKLLVTPTLNREYEHLKHIHSFNKHKEVDVYDFIHYINPSFVSEILCWRLRH